MRWWLILAGAWSGHDSAVRQDLLHGKKQTQTSLRVRRVRVNASRWQAAQREPELDLPLLLHLKNSSWPSPSANHLLHSSSASSAVTRGGPSSYVRSPQTTPCCRSRQPVNSQSPAHTDLPSNEAIRSLLLMPTHNKPSLTYDFALELLRVSQRR